MQNTVDTAWDRAVWGQAGQGLDICRWSFAWLPDARMKAVAAGWMARVLLGADPLEMSEEELQILAISGIMATRAGDRHGLHCDA
jgi:hypothetical protein